MSGIWPSHRDLSRPGRYRGTVRAALLSTAHKGYQQFIHSLLPKGVSERFAGRGSQMRGAGPSRRIVGKAAVAPDHEILNKSGDSSATERNPRKPSSANQNDEGRHRALSFRRFSDRPPPSPRRPCHIAESSKVCGEGSTAISSPAAPGTPIAKAIGAIELKKLIWTGDDRAIACNRRQHPGDHRRMVYDQSNARLIPPRRHRGPVARKIATQGRGTSRPRRHPISAPRRASRQGGRLEGSKSHRLRPIIPRAKLAERSPARNGDA